MPGLHFKIDGKNFATPIKVKLSGYRWGAMVVVLGLMAWDIGGIYHEMKESNRLESERLKVEQARLDLARRQFALDSIAVHQKMEMR